MASMKLPVALKSTAAGIGVLACMALTAALWDSEMNHVGSSRNPALHRHLAPSCEIEDQAFHCRPCTLQRPYGSCFWSKVHSIGSPASVQQSAMYRFLQRGGRCFIDHAGVMCH